MAIRVIGSSHRLAPPSKLHGVVAGKETIFSRLLGLQTQGRIRGAILLATCNRLEIIIDGHCTDPGLADAILPDRADLPIHEVADADATHYLLRVATGLESLVRGEDQILGQLREAFKHAERHELLSPKLRVLRTRLVAAARDTRRRTGMAKAEVSLASLAARQLERAGGRLVVVGAGETGRRVVETLVKRGHTDLLIVNRTLQRAQSLARHFATDERRVEAMSLHDFLALGDYDDKTDGPALEAIQGVLFAIDSREPVFFARHARGLRLVVDISMPSVLDASVRTVEGVEVLDLDDIAEIVETEGRRRESNLSVADELVQGQARSLHQALTEAGSSTTANLSNILERHLETAMNELQSILDGKLSHLPEVDQEQIRQALLRSTKRNAHLHLTDVRELSRS